MFDDLALSRSLTTEFHQKYPEHDLLNLCVFQPSNWPTYVPTPITLPSSMQDSLKSFEAFFKVVHPQRKLTWIHALSTVSLKGRFEAGDKELLVSLFQAVVLLLFNEEEEIKYEHIRYQVGLGQFKSVFLSHPRQPFCSDEISDRGRGAQESLAVLVNGKETHPYKNTAWEGDRGRSCV